MTLKEQYEQYIEAKKTISEKITTLEDERTIKEKDYDKAIVNEWRTNPKLIALDKFRHSDKSLGALLSEVESLWNAATKGMGKMHPEEITMCEDAWLCISARGIGYRMHRDKVGKYREVGIDTIKFVLNHPGTIRRYIRKSYREKFNCLIEEMRKIDFSNLPKNFDSIHQEVKVTIIQKEYWNGKISSEEIVNPSLTRTDLGSLYFSNNEDLPYILDNIDAVLEGVKEYEEKERVSRVSWLKLISILRPFAASQKIVDNL